MGYFSIKKVSQRIEGYMKKIYNTQCMRLVKALIFKYVQIWLSLYNFQC